MSDAEQSHDHGPSADSAGPIAVTGATGFVGGSMVRALLDAGYSVRALVRDVRSAVKKIPADLVEHERLQIVDGGPVFAGPATEGVDRSTGTLRLGDTEPGVARPLTQAEVLEGCSAMIHLVGILREAPGGQSFQRVHVDLTQRVIDACKAAHVDRLLHMSALGTTSNGKTEYFRSNAEAETLVRGSGLDWTIFRPGLIHGPRGEFCRMCAEWVRGAVAPWAFVPYFTKVENPDGSMMPPPGPSDPMVQPVSVEDVAQAFVSALDNDRTAGEIYNLVGPDRMSYPEMIGLFKDSVPGAKQNIPVLGLPGPVMALKAKAASFVGLRDLLPFDDGMAIMGSMDSIAEYDKATDHLGFAPRPFAATLKSYAGQL